MKKFLSLVLALVMTMSLVTISAGAKDFADDSDIDYKEAVDVISALGIVDGYSDSSFRPDGSLTRGAAAKIICNLILGPTTASALSASTAPFKDVPTTNVFAGYITYCAQRGIISGYGDGTFRPTGTLTGNAFMKMLLGALGYDSSIEGYTGSNWQVNVTKQAVGIGLEDGNDDFVGTRAVTRQEAALYALNMLQATMVEYDQQSTIVVGDIQINTSSSRKDVTNNANRETINEDDKMQFAERYFSDLRLSDGEDPFGRPSNVWTLKSNEIGTYAKEADVSYTASVEAGDIYKDLGLSEAVDKNDVTVFVNGEDTSDDDAVAIRRGSDTKLANSGNGTLTDVYYDADSGEITIAHVKSYIGEISKSVAATDSRDAYVEVITTVDAAGNKPDGAAGTERFETLESFKDEAKVIYTFSESEDEIQSVVPAEEVTGTVSKVVNKSNDKDNSSVTVNDTVYKASATMAENLLGAVSVDMDYTIYLDTYGYVISVSEEEFGDYALVLDIEGASGNKTGMTTNRAKLVFADGSVKTVNLDKNYKNSGVATGDIVSYRDTDDGYKLKEVKTQSTTALNTGSNQGSTSFSLKNDNAKIITSTTAGELIGSSNGTVYGNSKTTFVVYDNGGDEWNAYTGVKNAPTVEAQDLDNHDGDNNATTGIGDNGNQKEKVEAYWYTKSGTMTTIMFIIPGSDALVTDDNNNLLFLAGESVSDLIHDRDGSYYEYEAVVGSEIQTVKVESTTTCNGIAADKLNGLYSNYSVDSDGFITRLTPYTTVDSGSKYSGSGVGTDRNSADYTVVIKNGSDDVVTAANTGTWTVDDDAKFYEIDEDGNIETGAYSSVTKDDDNRAYYVIENGMVIYMFVEEVNSKDNAEKPTFTVTPNSSYSVTVGANLELTAEATVSDRGTVSYEWYSCNASGVADKKVGSGSTFKVDTSTAGTYHFLVTATNTNNRVDGKNTNSASYGVITVTVGAVQQKVSVAVYYSTDGKKDTGKVVGTEVVEVTAQSGVLVTVNSSDLKNIPTGYKVTAGLPGYVTVGDKAEVIVTVAAKSNDTKPVVGSFTFNNVGGGSGATATSSFDSNTIKVTVTPGSELQNDTLTATVTAPTGGTCDVNEIVLTYDGSDWQVTSGGTINTVAEDGTTAQYTVTVA